MSATAVSVAGSADAAGERPEPAGGAYLPPTARRDRGDIEALLFLGLAVGARGEADAAAPLLNRVARARSLNAHPCSDLARMLSARARRRWWSHSIARAWY